MELIQPFLNSADAVLAQYVESKRLAESVEQEAERFGSGGGRRQKCAEWG